MKNSLHSEIGGGGSSKLFGTEINASEMVSKCYVVLSFVDQQKKMW